MSLIDPTKNETSTGGYGNPLIPGMGGMNPTGSNPLNPTSTATAADNSLGGGSGVTGMATLNAPIGGGTTTDTGASGIPSSLLSNLGATTIPTDTSASSFPANLGATSGTTGNIQDLNLGSALGFGTDPNQLSQLQTYYGPAGTALYNLLASGGGYNPQIANALINQMSPQEERARNQILESFGASGGRYSSPAAIGLGDYESSFSLGQQGILANLAQSSTQNYTNILESILPTAHAEQSNKLSASDILSNLLKALAGSGAGTKGGGGGSSGGAQTTPASGATIHAPGGGYLGNTNAPTLPSSIPAAGTDTMNQILQDIFGSSYYQLPGAYGVPNAPFLPGNTPSAGSDIIDQMLAGITGGDPANVGTTITDPVTGLPIDTGSNFTDTSGTSIDTSNWFDSNLNDFSTYFDTGGSDFSGGDFSSGF